MTDAASADPDRKLWERVVSVTRSHRFAYRDEDELQAGLAAALTVDGLTVRREVRLSRRDRIDLLISDPDADDPDVTVGVEVKLAGAVDRLHAQLTRYATHELVDALVVVTTRSQHRTIPPAIGGKPCTVVHLGGVR